MVIFGEPEREMADEKRPIDWKMRMGRMTWRLRSWEEGDDGEVDEYDEGDGRKI